MARIITVVQTYFKDGTYRNNTVELQIPIEAAKLIEEYWKKQGIHKRFKYVVYYGINYREQFQTWYKNTQQIRGCNVYGI